MNTRIFEIAGLRVNGGIRGEFIFSGALAATTLGAAATPAAAGGAVAGSAAAMGGGAILAGTSAAAAAGGTFGATAMLGANVSAYGSSGMGLVNAANFAGTGMQAMQAFAGGSSGSGAIQKAPKLSGPAKENQKRVRAIEAEKYKEAEEGKLDTNLTSKYIRRFTKSTQAMSGAKQEAANITGARSQVDEGSKKGVGTSAGSKAIIAGTRGEIGEGLALQKDFAGMRREQMNEALVNMRNQLREKMWLKNREFAATTQRRGLEQTQRARQGAALGQIASMGGMMALMNRRQ